VPPPANEDMVERFGGAGKDFNEDYHNLAPMKYLNYSVFILILLFCLSACAVQQPGIADWNNADFPDSVIEHHIRIIEEKLNAHKRHGEIWYWSWMAINSGSMVGLGVAAGLTDDTADRVNFGSQAGLAALGVADLFFRPLEARYGADPIRNLPEATRAEKLKKLEAAEALLRNNAIRACDREYWLLHLLNLLLNAGVGIATGIAGDTTGGAISAGAGFVGGEIYILGQPGGPKEDWERYRRMVSNRPEKSVHIYLDSCDSGLMVRFRW
jgi:hypothetical protein